jgi:glycosyltransferase involved in cell wall biosynthesis
LEHRPRTFGILSTYPPTACGLATFSAALAAGLEAHGDRAVVVRVGDESTATATPSAMPTDDRIVAELRNGSPASVRHAADALGDADVALIQHEYGIYGGPDGDEVLDVLGALDIPSIVIAHTVLVRPTDHQRAVLVAVATLADRVVVMSEAARRRLCDGFDVDPDKVVIIPHGAAVPPPRAPSSHGPRPLLLTWGLVGPGKGIERVIDALPALRDLECRPAYLVAGRTHPKVLAADGDVYRQGCIELARRNGVADSVTFDPTYRDVPALTELIQSCAVVVLPYDSREQATSGVLVDAIAAGRPVVASAFPHAVELLGSGAGIVVDHDEPGALAAALRRILTDPGLLERMAAEAARLAPAMGWPVIAEAYQRLAAQLLPVNSTLVR